MFPVIMFKLNVILVLLMTLQAPMTSSLSLKEHQTRTQMYYHMESTPQLNFAAGKSIYKGYPSHSILHPKLDTAFDFGKTREEVTGHVTHPIAFFNNDLMRYGPGILQDFERSIKYSVNAETLEGYDLVVNYLNKK